MSEPENKVNELINAIGAMAEMSMTHYQHFNRVGFTPIQSLELVKSIIQITLSNANKGPSADGLENLP